MREQRIWRLIQRFPWFASCSAAAPFFLVIPSFSLSVWQIDVTLLNWMARAIWHHVAPWELPHQVELREGCWSVAGTRYLAPASLFFEARVLGLRSQALRASNARATTVQKPWFLLLWEQIGFVKSMVPSVAGTKGLSATVPKHCFFSRGRK